MVLSVETMVPYAYERGTCLRFCSMILMNLDHGIQELVPWSWRVYIEAWFTEIVVPCVKILDFETAVLYFNLEESGLQYESIDAAVLGPWY